MMMQYSPNVARGFFALIWLTMRRQWRIRAIGWSALGLVALIAFSMAIITKTRGWKFEDRYSIRYQTTYRKFYQQSLPQMQALPMTGHSQSICLAVFGAFRAQIDDQQFCREYELTNITRWVVFNLFLGFLLPLLNLAFASGAIGDEREDQTMIWLQTRPLPRGLIYLAKWLGIMPWCIVVSLLSFAVLCQFTGPMGREAFAHYWPIIALGSFAFASLFHLLGATISRPTVVGLAYIFFFETLVANLPGSLKVLSLNYYVKSGVYEILSRHVQTLKPEAMEIYAPTDLTTASLTLLLAGGVITTIGAYLFGRLEQT